MQIFLKYFYALSVSENTTCCPCEEIQEIQGILKCAKKNSIYKFPDDVLNPPVGCPSLNISRYWGLALQNQQIKELSKNAFLNFPNLTHITITNSTMERIDRHAFKGLNSLQTLILKRNNLLEIESGSLDNLVNLKYLDLTHNYLLKSYTTEAWHFCINAGNLIFGI